MSKRVSKEEFEQRLFTKRGSEYSLIGDFNNMTTKILVRHNCEICNNYEWEVMPSSILSFGCPKCGTTSSGDKQRGNITNTIKILDGIGYKFVSGEYVTVKSKIMVQCDKGHIYETCHNRLQQGGRCPYCVRIRQSKNQTKPESKRQKEFKEDNLQFINWVDGEYKNFDSRFISKCKEGHITERSYSSYTTHRGCPICNYKNCGKSGEEHYAWKGGASSIRTFLRNSLHDWKQKSMINCGFKCVITGEVFDDIHHIYSFDKILYEFINNFNIELKTNVSDYTKEELDLISKEFLELHNSYPLGICLTDEYHAKFHDEYGYGDNTEEQWNKFYIKNRKVIPIEDENGFVHYKSI